MQANVLQEHLLLQVLIHAQIALPVQNPPPVQDHVNNALRERQVPAGLLLVMSNARQVSTRYPPRILTINRFEHVRIAQREIIALAAQSGFKRNVEQDMFVQKILYLRQLHAGLGRFLQH